MTFLAISLATALASAAPDAQATKTASGSVTAVSKDSVTIKSGTDEMVFTVDKNTKITGRGASTKTAAAKADGKTGIAVIDMLSVGDRLTITFSDMSARLHAASIRVTAKGDSASACRESFCPKKGSCKNKCGRTPCICA